MKVSQVKDLVNAIQREIVGEEAIQTEDLSNVVDMGTEIFNITNVENYTRTLLDHIGRVVFVDRVYNGSAPSVLMDGWEFGSVLEKISCKIPEATENESWELQNGQSYDPNVFYKPTVSAKFYDSKVTFEVPMSITERQVKSAFSNATQLNAFFSMIYNNIDKSMTIKIDGLIMRTINSMIGETLYDEYKGGDTTAKSGIKAVNLLYLYNQKNPDNTLTAAKAVTNPDFIRFAAYEMDLYKGRLAKMSKLFNIGKEDRFTPSDLLHIVCLDEFYSAAKVYLQSDVWHNEFTALPKAETVSFWQGSGTNYEFEATSKIDVKTGAGNAVSQTGILGVMFDRDSLGVCNTDRRVTTNYNAKAEFTNSWTKFDCSYFNDTNENFVVFFVA